MDLIKCLPESYNKLYNMKKLVYVTGVLFLCVVAACSKPHGSAGGSLGYSPLTYVGSASLSESRSYLASAYTGNKAMFAGGLNIVGNNLVTDTVDLYDEGTGEWTVTHLSEPRYALSGAAAAGKIIFAGGFDNTHDTGVYTNRVDIYDTATGSWTTAQLSVPRMGAASASLGNWVFFGGGAGSTAGAGTAVDIYNAATGVWSTGQLSAPRFGLAAAAAGSKVIFAGGANGPSSNVVDIYDTLTRTWTTAELSEARVNPVAAAADGKILIAGGLGNAGNSSTVDIYDVTSGAWTTAHLSMGRENMAAAAIDDDLIFAGGNVIDMAPGGNGNDADGGVTDTADVYNARTNSWTLTRLSQAREGAVGAVAGHELLIGGGAIPVNPGSSSTVYQASALVDFFLVTGQ